MPKSSLKSRASSPIVMPWRIGIGYRPTKTRSPGQQHRPSDFDAADRVGPVADDDALAAVLRAARRQWPSCRRTCRCGSRRPAGPPRARRRPSASPRSARASRCRANTRQRRTPSLAVRASRSCCPARRRGCRAAARRGWSSCDLGWRVNEVGGVAQRVVRPSPGCRRARPARRAGRSSRWSSSALESEHDVGRRRRLDVIASLRFGPPCGLSTAYPHNSQPCAFSRASRAS